MISEVAGTAATRAMTARIASAVMMQQVFFFMVIRLPGVDGWQYALVPQNLQGKMATTIDTGTSHSFKKFDKVAQQTFTILDMLEMFVHIDKMMAIFA